MAGSTSWLEYFITLEGLIKILEFVSKSACLHTKKQQSIGVLMSIIKSQKIFCVPSLCPYWDSFSS